MEENFLKQSKPWANLVVVISGLLILVNAAWSKGLFFQEDFLLIHIIIGIGTLCFLPYIFEKSSFKINYLDWVFFYFGAIYSISIIGAANIDTAIGEALRVWTYVLYYFILSRALGTNGLVKLYMNGIIVIGTLFSVIGLLTVPGIIEFEGSWAQDFLNSTFQYHNAFAAFLIVPMILTVYFWLIEGIAWRGTLYSMAFILMSIAFAGTQSRGGYIIFFLAMLFFFVYNRTNRKDFILLPVLNIVAGVLIWGKFLTASTSQVKGMPIAWLLSGILFAFVVHLAGIFINRLQRKDFGNFIKPIIIIISLVLVTLGFYVFIHSGSDVLTRIKSINIHDHSVEERFIIYTDALKMFIHSPLTGYGGGGWSAAFRTFQSYFYNSTETHSIVLKIIVETGLLGVIALIALPIAIIKMLLDTRKLNNKKEVAKNSNNTNWAIIVAIMGIVGHALIDFDLSEGALSLLLWGLFAVLRASSIEAENLHAQELNNLVIDKNPSKGRKNISVKSGNSSNNGVLQVARLPLGVGLGFIAIILIVVPILIKTEMKNSNLGLKQINLRSYQIALNYYDIAEQAYPFKASDWDNSARASLQLALINQDRQFIDRALNDSNRAADLSKYDSKILNNKANILIQTGQEAEAYNTLRIVKDSAPLITPLYNNFAIEGIYYSMSLIKSGDLNTAKEVANEVMNLPKLINDKMNSLSPLYKRNWQFTELLKVTPALELLSAEAKVLLGRDDGKTDLLRLVADPVTTNDAKIWLGALALKTGETELMKFVSNASDQDLKSMQNITAALGKL